MVEQISVFLDNRPGRLAELCNLMGNNGIDIRALQLVEAGEFGLVRMITDNNSKAIDLLKNSKMSFRKGEVLGVLMEDKPGTMGLIASLLGNASINIEYAYAFVSKIEKKAILILKVSDIKKSIDVLKSNKIDILEKI
ncbi:MAG: hypothetical protein AMQ74_00221 [Candidatus Methanofastidiosum methylothiophilum]|uniref:ACT domain-containing protein n=1 Tax=Candidatus Methanofastidiosum methylothiophilum TaxID=1705564 RepID=A0A150J9S4_9EURY|nr:MAG: hypothetical protein AMQ74_00221 [Candidatus Methanofastidiosum methylthiophilus]NMC76788.1 hypothetical protein [Candidatus Methanofastidiosa archaeon]